MRIRREMIGEDRYQAGMASLSRELDQGRAARWIVSFLRGETATAA